MSGGGTNTVTQNSAPPQQFLNAYQNINNQAQRVASQPLQQYQGNIVAPLSAEQNNGITNINSAASNAQPYTNAAAGEIASSTQPLLPGVQPYLTNAQNFLNQGAGTNFAGAVSPWVGAANNYYNQGATQNFIGGVAPYLGAAATGFNNAASTNLTGAISPAVQQAGGMFGSAGSGITYNPVTAAQIANYESPYTQAVVNSTQAQFNNQNAQQQQQVVGNAISQGAFGGDRAAVAQALTAGQQQLAQAPVIAGLENQGYSQALGEANTQQAAQMQQQIAQTQAGLTGAQGIAGLGALGLSAAQGQGQLQLAGAQGIAGLGSENLAATQAQSNALLQAGQGSAALGSESLAATQASANAQFQAAQGTQGLGQTALGANEANAWLASQAGYGLSNLGNQTYGQLMGTGQAQLGAGGLQQQVAQEQLNVPYQQFLAQQAYPFQTTGWQAGIAEGTGAASGGSASTTSPAPSTGSQIAGGLLAGTGILGATGAFGSAGWLTPLLFRKGGGVPRDAGGLVPDLSISYVPEAGHGLSGPTMPKPPAPAPASGSQNTPLGAMQFVANLKNLANIKNGPKYSQSGSYQTGLLTGLGNWASGNSWDGMANGANLASLDAQAQMNTQNGGPMARGGGLNTVPFPSHLARMPGIGRGGLTANDNAPHIPHMPKMLAVGGGLQHRDPGGGLSMDLSSPMSSWTDNEIIDPNAPTKPMMFDAQTPVPSPPPVAHPSARGSGHGLSAHRSVSIPTPPPAPADGGGLNATQAPPPRDDLVAAENADMSQKAANPTDTSSPTSSSSAPWQTLLAAGLGIMGGTSPHALVNIGRGGLQGLEFGEQQRAREEQEALRRLQEQDTEKYHTGELGLHQQQIQQTDELTKAQMAQKQAFEQAQLGQQLQIAKMHIGMEGANLAETRRYHDETLNQGRYSWSAGMGPDPTDPTKQVAGMYRLPTKGGEEPQFIAGQTLTTKTNGAPAVPPDVTNMLAERVMAGDNSALAGLGYGTTGTQARIAVQTAVTHQLASQGLTGADLAAKTAEYMGEKAGARTAGTREANVGMAVNEAQKFIPLALQASALVPRTQFPTFNSIMQAYEKGTGDENIVRLAVATNSLVNAYSRAITPSGIPTEGNQQRARELLDKAWSQGQYSSAVDQLNKEMLAAKASPVQQQQEQRERISGRSSQTAPAPAPTLPSAPSAPQWKYTAVGQGGNGMIHSNDGAHWFTPDGKPFGEP
jgi:hypothetical protein